MAHTKQAVEGKPIRTGIKIRARARRKVVKRLLRIVTSVRISDAHYS